MFGKRKVIIKFKLEFVKTKNRVKYEALYCCIFKIQVTDSEIFGTEPWNVGFSVLVTSFKCQAGIVYIIISLHII